jgi:hypothetical protein
MRPFTLGIAATVLFGAGFCLGVAPASASIPARFRWFAPAPAPSGWKHLGLPSGGAILSYPPSLARIRSDKGSVSVAKTNRSGRILVYLNVTPKQGDERLGTWPEYRITHNRGESDAVHLDARAFRLPFLGGSGSCVIDDYATRVNVNHYREIACFVEGATTASVLVAAALESEWKRAAPVLERAVSAFRA